MSTQQAPPRKKKGYWLILPFILIIGLVLFKTIDFKSGKISTPISTKFAPEELINLVENYDINNIAGVCIGKGFIQFKHENASNYGLCNQYILICTNKKMNKEDIENEGKCKGAMNECISLWDNEKTVEISFADDHDYNAFIDNLKSIPVTQFTGEKCKGFENFSHYVRNNVVIIPEGYDINAKNFGVLLTRVDEISRVNNKIVQDSISEQKERGIRLLDSIKKAKSEIGNIAIVKVNQAPVYTQRGDAYENPAYYLCTVFKGNKLIIQETNGSYFLCDFICNDKPVSGWINKQFVLRK